MNEATTDDPRAVAKAVIADGLGRLLTVEDACRSAGLSRRTYYNLRAADAAFAAACDRAIEDAAHVVNRTRMTDWAAALAKHDADLEQIAAELHEVAAPALVGDAASQQRQAELQARRAQVEEAAATLRTALASGEAHLQRQAAERQERDRQAAAAEDARLAEQQRAAASEIDGLFAAIEAAVGRFQDAAVKRQSAQRRATGRSRPVVADRQVMQALFHNAPRFAQLIGADRKLAAHARALGDLV
jgi:hypothetical protein